MKKIFPQLFSVLAFTACGGGAEYSDTFEILDPAVEDPQLLTELARTDNRFVRAAMSIRSEAEAANVHDIDLLLRLLRGPEASSSGQEVETAKELLASDKQRFSALKSELNQGATPEQRGTPPLRTSLEKLTGKNGITGILDDAAAMLETRGELFAAGTFGDFRPHHNEITVAKTSLFYLIAARSGADAARNILPQLRLLYPAQLPEGHDPAVSDAEASALFTRGAAPTLHIPNAGYIFGGNFQGDHKETKGIDCSAFLAHVTESSVRFSTMLLEYTWRVAVSDDFSLDDPDGSIRADLLANWGLDRMLDEYEGLSSDSPAAIGPGVLVVWRAPQGQVHRSGHVVMALSAVDPGSGRFYAVEAARTDDKSIEGIVVRHLTWTQDDADTYLLRRKETAEVSSVKTVPAKFSQSQ